jgi:hypothetical protein
MRVIHIILLALYTVAVVTATIFATRGRTVSLQNPKVSDVLTACDTLATALRASVPTVRVAETTASPRGASEALKGQSSLLAPLQFVNCSSVIYYEQGEPRSSDECPSLGQLYRAHGSTVSIFRTWTNRALVDAIDKYAGEIADTAANLADAVSSAIVTAGLRTQADRIRTERIARTRATIKVDKERLVADRARWEHGRALEELERIDVRDGRARRWSEYEAVVRDASSRWLEDRSSSVRGPPFVGSGANAVNATFDQRVVEYNRIADMMSRGYTLLPGAASVRSLRKEPLAEALIVETAARIADSQPHLVSRVWAYWEGGDVRSGHALAGLNNITVYCLEAQARAANLTLVLLNDRTIRDYLPYIHPQVWNVSSIASRADYFRAALLFYYGGLWIDVDTLVRKPLSWMLPFLTEADFVAFSYGGLRAPVGILAARAHSVVARRWVETLHMHLDEMALDPSYVIDNSETKLHAHHRFGRVVLNPIMRDVMDAHENGTDFGQDGRDPLMLLPLEPLIPIRSTDSGRFKNTRITLTEFLGDFDPPMLEFFYYAIAKSMLVGRSSAEVLEGPELFRKLLRDTVRRAGGNPEWGVPAE